MSDALSMEDEVDEFCFVDARYFVEALGEVKPEFCPGVSGILSKCVPDFVLVWLVCVPVCPAQTGNIVHAFGMFLVDTR